MDTSVPAASGTPDGGRIQAILFDYGNVLYTWDAAAAIAGRVDAALWHEYLDSGAFWHYNEMADAGLPIREIMAALVADHPDKPRWHEAQRLYFEYFMDSLTGPVPGSAGLVEELAAAGHRLALLSNFHHEFFAAQAHLCPQLALFDELVISGNIHLTKPNPEIFTYAYDRLGLAPHEILFIDDSRRNIDAAARLGIRTHLFTSAGSLRLFLHAEGLLPPRT